MMKETLFLVREHKLYFLSPLLLLMCVLAILFFKMGPAIIMTFIYAGV